MLEERAHALMFLGELVALNDHQEPLTNATYQRDAYSVYSPEITEELQRMNLPSRKVYRGEHRVPIYDTKDVSCSEINNKAETILDQLVESVSDLSTDEIIEMCRRIPEVRLAQLDQTLELSSSISFNSLDETKDLIWHDNK